MLFLNIIMLTILIAALVRGTKIAIHSIFEPPQK